LAFPRFFREIFLSLLDVAKLINSKRTVPQTSKYIDCLRAVGSLKGRSKILATQAGSKGGGAKKYTFSKYLVSKG
jgi:hypothetical protein